MESQKSSSTGNHLPCINFLINLAKRALNDEYDGMEFASQSDEEDGISDTWENNSIDEEREGGEIPPENSPAKDVDTQVPEDGESIINATFNLEGKNDILEETKSQNSQSLDKVNASAEY